MGFRIDGKFAVITGAGRDIGAACMLEPARDGADVVVHFLRSADEVLRVNGGLCFAR